MAEYANLEDTITDAVNDAQIDDAPETVDTPAVEENAAPEAAEAVPEASPEASEESPEVPSPAAEPSAAPAEPQDEFSKLAGVSQMGVGGRENRIPYSRVKKITEKAVSEKEATIAEAVLGRKLNSGEKALDAVKAHVAQLPELQTKVTDYESRLEAVGRFENVMANEPEKFLEMLSRLPAYAEFFNYVRQVASGQPPAAGAAPAQEAAAPAEAAMPEPDEELSDGSKVYSMEGLKKLLDWNARQVESRVASKYETTLSELQKKYDPVAQDWQTRQRQEAVLPVIRKQIEEARKWALFNESEEEILTVLQSDPAISLEGAYRQVVFPKLVAERDKVRQGVLQELKTAPTASNVTSRAATKPNPPASGPRSIEDIIKEQVETLKR